MIRSFNKLLRGRDFLRSAMVLVSGTALSQALLLLALPLLTRLYSPDDFSVLAVYVAVVGIFAAAACLGFDLAIAMPALEQDALHLLAMALLCAAGMSMLVAFGVSWLDPAWFDSAAVLRVLDYRWLVPVGVFLTAVFAAVQLYAVRQKKFGDISRARVWQSAIGVMVQLAGAGLQWFPGGLLVGQAVGSGSGSARLLLNAWRDKSRWLSGGVSVVQMLALGREYRRFPQYTTFESLSNNLGIQLPVILIAMWVVGPEAGFLLLAMRAMQTPIGMVGGAVGQVYLSQAPGQDRCGELGAFTNRVLAGAIKVGIAPIVFMGFVAPGVFELVFGSGWSRAGELVCWMTPWFVLQYLASPISMVMHVRGQQRMMLLLTLVGLVLRAGTLILMVRLSPAVLSEAYALSGALFYLLCFGVFIQIAGLTLAQTLRLVLQVLAFALGGGLAGIFLNVLLGW
jgi:O-antigen/teichoic acid export membrane protein